MNAGGLNKRIAIQAPSRSVNALGETIDTFATIATVWGAIEPLSGSKYFQALQANVDVSGRIRIRYRDIFKPTWRLKYKDRILLVVSIIHPEEAREELHIMYREQLD